MEFFATTRAIENQGMTFTAEYSGKTQFVRMPNVDKPAVNSKLLDGTDWAKQVFAEGGGRDVLIVVHGYNVKQNSFMKEVSGIRKRVKARSFKGAVVGFDWPSNGKFWTYDDDRSDAAKSAAHLAEVIKTLIHYKPSARIHILAHSMGTRVVSGAFEHAEGDPAGGKIADAINQVIFTAAEIPQDWTKADGSYLQRLLRFSDRFTCYWSKHDDVLKAADDQFGEKTQRLGRGGLLGTKLGELEHVDCTGYYRSEIWSGLFTRSHNWYYRHARYSDPFFIDLTQVLKRQTGPFHAREGGSLGRYSMKT